MEIALIIVAGILVLTWMAMSFAKKEAGLEKGASQREIEALQEHVNHIQEEIISLKKEVRQLIQIAKGHE